MSYTLRVDGHIGHYARQFFDDLLMVRRVHDVIAVNESQTCKFSVSFRRIGSERFKATAREERRLGLGEREVDGGALAELAFEPKLTPMGLHQVLDDRQP